MTARIWLELCAQSLAHALVAALATEALLRLWRARAPDDRLALRALALLQPLLVTPALAVLLPARRSEAFQDRWALFSADRWSGVRIGRASALEIGVVVSALAGSALLVMDLLPLLPGSRRRLPPAVAAPPALEAALEAALAAFRARSVGAALRRPTLHYVDAPGAVLFCAGVRAPALVVSRGALDLLDPQELRAALAHELAHLAARDPLLSWGLMAVRGALFFNPVAQVLARALTRDAEWRADERAGAERLALASAVLKLHRAGLAQASDGGVWRSLPFAAALHAPLRRARSHDVRGRCERLLEPDPPTRLAFSGLRRALAWGSLAGLLVLVT